MNELIEIHEKYAHLQKDYFMEHALFSWQWWFQIFITVALWIIWAFLVDKRRMKSILITGLLASIITLVLDDIGLSMALWVYPYHLHPFSSQLYAADLAIIPITYMLLYQYFRKWQRYIAAITVLVLFGVFVAEPFFIKSNLYLPLHWKPLYSLPIYLMIGVFLKGIVDGLDKKYEQE